MWTCLILAQTLISPAADLQRSCSLAHNRFRDLGLDCWTQSYEWRNINTELDSLSLFHQIFFNNLVKSGQKCLNYG